MKVAPRQDAAGGAARTSSPPPARKHAHKPRHRSTGRQRRWRRLLDLDGDGSVSAKDLSDALYFAAKVPEGDAAGEVTELAIGPTDPIGGQ